MPNRAADRSASVAADFQAPAWKQGGEAESSVGARIVAAARAAAAMHLAESVHFKERQSQPGQAPASAQPATGAAG